METGVLRKRLLILMAMLLCAGACWLVGGLMHVPNERGFDASLLNQPNPAIAVIVVAVMFVVCCVLVSMVLGRRAPNAGLVCAAIGIAMFSIRGGSVMTTLQYASSPSVFLLLAGELVVLYAIVGASIYLSRGFAEIAADNSHDEGLNHHLLAVAVQVVVMGIFMLLLGQSESKKQAMASVAVASAVGAIVGQYTFTVRRGTWFVIAPLVVGIVGYVMEWTSPTLFAIGHVRMPLATPLPLDYVAAGIVGGIFGFDTAVKWQQEALANSAQTT